MARRKRVEADLTAWAKAFEAEAKRAERAAKNTAGSDIGEVWATYAGRCRREAVEVSRRDPLPLELDLTPTVTPPVVGGNAWRDHLLALEAADVARFAAAKGVTV
jgi:hypothetical protein